MFSPNFSTEFFPRIFGVCFSAVRTVNATEKRPPKNSARKSIAAQSKIQSANVAGVETSQHALLRSKNYPEKLKISSARSSAPLCLPMSLRKPRGWNNSRPLFWIEMFKQPISDLELSIEIENFKREWEKGLIILGIIKVGIEHFKRNWNFQTRLKISILDWKLQAYPKDPAVLETLRDSELLRRSVFTMPQIYYAVNPSLRRKMSAILRGGQTCNN